MVYMLHQLHGQRPMAHMHRCHGSYRNLSEASHKDRKSSFVIYFKTSLSFVMDATFIISKPKNASLLGLIVSLSLLEKKLQHQIEHGEGVYRHVVQVSLFRLKSADMFAEGTVDQVQSCQTVRSLFLGRFWVKIDSDECSRSV